MIIKVLTSQYEGSNEQQGSGAVIEKWSLKGESISTIVHPNPTTIWA